jgi:HSP20 family protein
MLTIRLRGARSLVPFGWSDLSWLPFLEPSIRIEDYVDDDRYVVRAELPGVDPTKDVDITYADGALRLSVVRGEEHQERGRSEFHHGSFHRTIPLPVGAKEDTIAATYKHGILEITVLVGEPSTIGKHIPIAIGNGSVKPAKRS